MANNAQGGGIGRRGASTPLLIIGILILAALIGVIIALVMLLNREQSPQEPEASSTEQRTTVINEENAEEALQEIIAEDAERVRPGYYEAVMNTTWHFPDGYSPSTDSYVENSSNNTNAVYFDIKMRDTGDVIYRSPIIPVGGHMENIKMDVNLGEDTYNCICEYHLVDENQKSLSTVSMGLTLVVGAG
jgi:hypothetical protein